MEILNTLGNRKSWLQFGKWDIKPRTRQRASWLQRCWCLYPAKQPFNFKANFQDKPFLFLYNRQLLGQFFSEVAEILVIGPQGHIEKKWIIVLSRTGLPIKEQKAELWWAQSETQEWWDEYLSRNLF